MEHHLEPKSISRNQQISEKAEKILLPQVTQSKKAQDRLKSEKFNLSYADLHHEIRKSIDNIPPKSSGNHQKQQFEHKATKDEELIRYMSNLPSYLERGENFQEKALSFGVLDWGRLEKWQYDHKQIPNKTRRHSSSSSNSSSLFSTDESSTHSSRGDSCSPTHQRIRRPTLQSHLKASPAEGLSEGVKFFGGNAGKFQDLNATHGTPLSGQQRSIGTNHSSCKIQSEIKLEKFKRNSSDPMACADMRTSTNLNNCEMASCSKGMMKTQDGDFKGRKEGSQEPSPIIIFKDCPQRYKTAVVHSSRDLPMNGHSELSQLPGTSAGQGSAEASRKSYSEGSYSTEVHSAKLYSVIPRSCPLPRDVDSSKASQINQPSSTDVESIKFPFDASVHPTHLVRSKNPEEKKTTMVPTNSTAREPSEESDLKKGTVASAKVRNPSPTRRFSISTSRMLRSSSFRDGLTPSLSCSHVDSKSGPDRAVAACMDSFTDEQNATSRARARARARSSPLRRLLDPLLRPKAGNSSQFSEPSQGDSTSTDRSCLSSEEHLDSSNSRSGKVKLDLTSCRTINVNDSYKNKKHGSLPVQALLQVAVKNGLPLFTFAVDSDKDILAATMKKCTTGKDDYSWIYTFFTISEVKKKNRSWINQGQKGNKGHGYIPNVVAQMKVSDSQFASLTRCNSAIQFSLREFVLFAVNLGQADEQTSNIQPNDELAAIVIKIPKETAGSSSKDEQQSCYTGDLSGSISNDNPPEVERQSMWEENVQNQPHFITKVILPSGIHSLPNKGEPSRLLERWKSGGSCDCGGWDMGCKLRVLVNQNQHRKKQSLTPNPSPPSTDRFELFSLEGVEADEPIYSLSSFKDGIYSAEFNSSISLLQAFSICIAVLNSWKKPSEMSNPFEERSEGKIETPNQVQGEAPASYVSYPPLSPVGRV